MSMWMRGLLQRLRLHGYNDQETTALAIKQLFLDVADRQYRYVEETLPFDRPGNLNAIYGARATVLGLKVRKDPMRYALDIVDTLGEHFAKVVAIECRVFDPSARLGSLLRAFVSALNDESPQIAERCSEALDYWYEYRERNRNRDESSA